MGATRPKIVGREREIGALKSALDSVAGSAGRAIGLFGEPGIGKTTLANLATEMARGMGFTILKGHCQETAGAPAFWPWIELIRELLSGRSDEDAVQLLGDNISWLAQISPEASKFRSSSTPLPTAMAPEEFRFQLFDALSQTLKRASASGPLALVIEDVHWADEGSLRLLELLAGSIGDSSIAMIITSRGTEMAANPQKFSKTVGELMRRDVFSRLDLSRLSSDATAEQVVSLGGKKSGGRVHSAIFASTDGNPFFTTEVVRLLAQEGRLDASAADNLEIGVPGGVAEVIGRRLSGLEERELDLLRTCSVIGQEIEVELLARISGSSPHDLLNDLERPIANQILQLDGPNLHFTHALIGEAVSSGLPASDLVNRHARVAESLFKFAGGNIRPYVQRLAIHYVAAQAVTGTDRAVEFSLLAGDEALRLSEFDAGRRHYRRVLDLTANEEINDIRARALGGLWKVESRTAHEFEITGFVPLLTSSFNYFVSNGDTERAIDLAAWASTPYTSPRCIDEVIARAMELVSLNSLDAGRLMARKIASAYMERRALDESLHNFDRAISIARKYGDNGLELTAIANIVSVYGHSSGGLTDLGLVSRGIELALATSDLFSESVILFQAAGLFSAAGDSLTARHHIKRLREIDNLIKSPNRKATNLSIEASLCHSEGLWDDARQLIEEALKIDETDLRPMTVAVRVEYETGNFERAQHYFDRMTASSVTGPGSHPYSSSLRALLYSRNFEITGDKSHLMRARELSEPVIDAGAPTGSAERHHRAALLYTAVHTNDIGLAEKNYRPLRGMGYGGDFGMWTDRALASSAVLLGDIADAESIHNDMLAMRRNAGHHPELAWTCFNYSTLLMGRNGSGDLELAKELIGEALAITDRLGMPPLKSKLDEFNVELSKRMGRNVLPAGLSRRELEVLKLVAAGMTNGRIADELFISTHTVVRHVSNIMSKTGSSSRTEAGLFAERNGLL